MTNEMLKHFAEMVETRMGKGYAEADVKFISPTEVQVTTVSGEDGENIHHQVLVTVMDDIIDVTRIHLENNTLIYHETIVLDGPDPDEEYPYGFIDYKEGFCGDADCDLLSLLYDSIPGMNWDKVHDRTVTLCQMLDHIKDAIEHPQPTFEEFIHAALSAAVPEGPVNLDESDENNE